MAGEILIGDIGLAAADPRIAVTRGDSTASNVVDTIGSVGGEIVQGVQEGRSMRNVREVGEALDQVNEVIGQTEKVEQGQMGTSPDIDAFSEKLSTRAKSHFNTILADMQQSNRRGTAALKARMLAEKEIMSITSQTPGFSREIRSAAAEVLGFDPTGETLKTLFNMRDPEQGKEVTEAEKMQSMIADLKNTDIGKAMIAETTMGGTADEVLDKYRKSGALETARDNYLMKVQWESGSMSTDNAISQFLKNSKRLSSPPALISGLIDQAKAGGMDSLDQATALFQIDQMKEAQYQGFINSAPEGAVLTDSHLTKLRNQIDAQYAGVERFISDTNSFNILKEKVDTLGALTDIGLYQNFEELMIYNRLNPGLGVKVLEMQEMALGDPDRAELLAVHFRELHSIMSGEGVDRIRELIGREIPSFYGAPTPGPDQGGSQTPVSPQAKTEAVTAAASAIIDNRGLEEPTVSEQLRQRRPKFTIAKLAKNPELVRDIPEEEKGKWRATYFGQLYSLVNEMGEKGLPQGTRLVHSSQRDESRDPRALRSRGPVSLVGGASGDHRIPMPSAGITLNNTFFKLAEDSDLVGVPPQALTEVVNHMISISSINQELESLTSRLDRPYRPLDMVNQEALNEELKPLVAQRQALIQESNHLASEIARIRSINNKGAGSVTADQVREELGLGR